MVVVWFLGLRGRKREEEPKFWGDFANVLMQVEEGEV